MKTKIALVFLAALMVSSSLLLSVSAPARRTECIGKGIYRIKDFSYTEQDVWPPLT